MLAPAGPSAHRRVPQRTLARVPARGVGRRGEELIVTAPEGDSERHREVVRFVERLTREDLMLIVLKRELYEGCWDDMVADLEARLKGRPYVFKLANRITEDLERIARLRAFEEAHEVDLADYVKMT